MLWFAAFLISLIASIVGAICGIGGGVVIKPTLDLFQLMSVSTISFLSSCTVLAMSTYSVVRSFTDGKKVTTLKINLCIAVPLAIGSVIGGISGKELFSFIEALFENSETVGAVQSLLLVVITLCTLIYTLRKGNIKTHSINIPLFSILIGFGLGLLSTFLGIGGGPINLMVLSYFYSMDTKLAAKSSLFVIMFSQFASFLTTLATDTIPEFNWIILILMVAGGLIGSIAGCSLNKRMSVRAVDKLFVLLMSVIIIVSTYNIIQYL